MKLWVLFIWMNSVQPYPAGFSYRTLAECEQDGQHYKRAVCVQVEVPRK